MRDVLESPVLHGTCTRCHTWKEFAPGRGQRCHECERTTSRERYARNRERTRARAKQYVEDHPALVAAQRQEGQFGTSSHVGGGSD